MANRRGAALRFLRLDAERRALLVEAAVLLTIAALAVRLLPFRWAVQVGARLGGRARAESVERIRWSIEAAADRLPFRIVCFQKGLAMQAMLRRRGVAAQLKYGVRFTEESALQAHVWVQADGAIVIGGEEAPRFQAVAAYPQ